jgi:lantibiotic transport system permease protein
MLKLLSVELLKIRRSLALLMMVAIPLMVVVLNAAMLLKRPGLAALGPQHWPMYWMGNTGLWCYFMLPLYIALVTGLLNGQEHKNQTWRLMLTLPVSPYQLYAAKGLLALLFVLGANTVLIAGVVLSVGVLGVSGANIEGAFAAPMLLPVAKVTLACLPVLVIQHAVSWRFQNIVLPLAIGVVATMGIVQIGSSAKWVYFPWSYPMMAVNGSDVAMQQQALLLAAVAGSLLFAASTFVLGRRETGG